MSTGWSPAKVTSRYIPGTSSPKLYEVAVSREHPVHVGFGLSMNVAGGDIAMARRRLIDEIDASLLLAYPKGGGAR